MNILRRCGGRFAITLVISCSVDEFRQNDKRKKIGTRTSEHEDKKKRVFNTDDYVMTTFTCPSQRKEVWGTSARIG